jgi:hypothetical protein
MMQITSINPTEGPVGITVTISGNGFPTDSENLQITLANSRCEQWQVINSNTITVTVPNDAPSFPAPFYVMDDQGNEARSPQTFTADIPDPDPTQISIDYFAPTTTGPGTWVTLNGDNLNVVDTVTFGPAYRAPSLEVLDATRLRVLVPTTLQDGAYYIIATSSEGERTQSFTQITIQSE